MKKSILIFLLSILSIGITWGQRETLKINTNYNVAKIYTKNNSLKKVKNFEISKEGITAYSDFTTGKAEKIELNKIRLVKIKTGDHALAYGLYGAGFMALSSLYAAAEIANDPYLEPKDNANAIYAGLKPVIADVDVDTLCLSIESVRERISKNTVAIILVYIFGNYFYSRI